MRTYKFRAWTGKSFIYIDFAQNQYLEWTDYEIDQWTGLKDKNGEDIYEGDIVDNGIIPADEVFFVDGMFMLKFNESLLSEEHTFCETIGNIHENPELL